MSRNRKGLNESEIERLCESLDNHRAEIRDQLSDLTGESASSLQAEAKSINLDEFEVVPLNTDDDDEDGLHETATVKVTGGGSGSHGSAIAKPGGESGARGGFEKGSLITCADNTGARELKIISVHRYTGTKNRYPKARLGDKITASVTKGTPDMRRQVLEAVIIRQQEPIRRPDGTRIKFEDNAAVIIDEDKEPRGTEINGPIPREVANQYGSIASLASTVV